MIWFLGVKGWGVKNVITVKTEINLNDIAAQLASESDEIQAKFLNVFFKALDLACENEYQTQMQLCHIWEKLSDRPSNYAGFFEGFRGKAHQRLSSCFYLQNIIHYKKSFTKKALRVIMYLVKKQTRGKK